MATQLDGRVVLSYFCVIQFLTYFDRGALSGLLTNAERKFQLNGELSGFLGSSYFVSVMIVAPVMAGAMVRAKGQHQMYAVASGCFMFAVAAFFCYSATSYSMLLVGRILSGLGEAGYCVFASPIIDDAAPPGRKSLYQGAFYMLVYVATGVGFAAPSRAKDWDAGRILFLVEAVAVLPFALFGFVFASRFHSTHRSGSSPVRENMPLDSEFPGTQAIEQQMESTETLGMQEQSGCKDAVVKIIRVLTTLQYFLFWSGYNALIFCLNGWNFWGPSYMEEVLHLPKSRGSLQLGAVVIVGGLGGSAVGAVILERITDPNAGKAARARAAAKVCSLSCILAIPFGIVSVSTRSPLVFLCFATIFIFLLTCSTAPSVVGMMEAVAADCRGIAMGFNSFGCHIFGDVLSPIIVGFIKDKTGSLVAGMYLLVSWTALAAFCWGLAILTSRVNAPIRGREELTEQRN